MLTATVCAVILLVVLAMIAQAIRGNGVNPDVLAAVFKVVDVIVVAIVALMPKGRVK